MEIFPYNEFFFSLFNDFLKQPRTFAQTFVGDTGKMNSHVRNSYTTAT